MTEWRQFRDSVYEVSDTGVIRNQRTGRILSQTLGSRGYLVVTLGRTIKTRSVHSVVLEAFAGPRPPGLQGRHRNGDKLDNRATNLSWGTPSQNTLDQVAHGTHDRARRTRCPAGHPYDEVNTYLGANGERRCNECRKTKSRRRVTCPTCGKNLARGTLPAHRRRMHS